MIATQTCSLIILGSKVNVSKESQLPLRIGEGLMESSADARNIGVVFFNETMYLEHHIKMICKSAWSMLRQVGLMRKYLHDTPAERLIHMFMFF